MLDDADDIHPLFYGAPKSTEFKKLRKRIVQNVREAVEQYGMIEDGARWLVCLSGGKDSYTLLAILYELKWRGLLPVDLLACNLDQGQPGFPATVLPEFLEKMGVPHRIEYQDTYSIVMDKIPQGRTFCALCSRLRRGNLYRVAREEGCSAVVLGHHRDDILETFFMNLFHGGRVATMPPKLVNEEGDLFVYRPLAHVAEVDCERFARAMDYPIIPCDLCGSQDGLQRQQVKQLLDGSVADKHPAVSHAGSQAFRLCRPYARHKIAQILAKRSALLRSKLPTSPSVRPIDGKGHRNAGVTSRISQQAPRGGQTQPARATGTGLFARSRAGWFLAWRRNDAADRGSGNAGDLFDDGLARSASGG